MDLVEATKSKLYELVSRNRGRRNSHNAAWLRNAEQSDDARDDDDEDQELPLCRSKVQATRACFLAREIRFRSLRPPFIGIEVLMFRMWKSWLRGRRGVNLLRRG